MLDRQYPDAEGKSVRIQIDSPSGAHPRIQDLLARIRAYLAKDGDYARAIAARGSAVRVVSGHEMGRFRQRPTH